MYFLRLCIYDDRIYIIIVRQRNRDKPEGQGYSVRAKQGPKVPSCVYSITKIALVTFCSDVSLYPRATEISKQSGV